MEQLGCLRRIRIPGNLNLQSGIPPSNSPEVTRLNTPRRSTLTKCLKFERDLQPSEWAKALQNVETSEERPHRLDDSDDDDDGGDEDSGNGETSTINRAGSDQLQLISMNEPARVHEASNILNTMDMAEVVLPAWARGTLSTLIFEKIKDSRKSGILSVVS